MKQMMMKNKIQTLRAEHQEALARAKRFNNAKLNKRADDLLRRLIVATYIYKQGAK